MSHFTVLVIGNNPTEQLAPFQENNMGDCPEEYIQFFDCEDECRNKYDNETVERIILPAGSYVSPYRATPEEEVKGKRVEVPFNVAFNSYDEFVEDWYGYRKDPETGHYGYYENPQAKWDWYQLGGRWTGMFKLKEGAEGIQGEPGLMTEPANNGWVDAAYKKDIDFEGMVNHEREQANKKYDEIERILQENNITDYGMTFKQLMDIYQDRDAARSRYWDQPIIKALKQEGFSMWGEPKETYFLGSGGREAYVNDCINSIFTTFAVIKDGKWYERGEMGWWGVVSDENDNWNEEFNKLFNSLPDTTLLSVFDCHI